VSVVDGTSKKNRRTYTIGQAIVYVFYLFNASAVYFFAVC
jgi:hypothetical protein